MNQIKVSVVIPSYNSSKTIEKCLDSFSGQKNRKKFEPRGLTPHLCVILNSVDAP